MVKDTWLRVKEGLSGKLPAHTISTWFDPINQIALKKNEFVLEVPSQFFYDWIESHYRSNINFVLEKTKGDRLNLKNELEKIKNFSQSKLSVEFDDLLKIISSSEDYKISELTDHCLAKNKQKTIKILNDNNSSVENNILILKSFLYKLKRLEKLKKEIEIKKNQDQVISAYKPSIFWKDKDIIKKQLNTLSINDIKSFIKKVNKLELLIKKNANISNEITNNFIFETIENTNNLF